MSKSNLDDQAFKTSIAIARHGGTVITGSLISSALRFLSQVILGRSLGPEGYGLYALGFSIFSIAGQTSQLGLSDSVVKFGVAYSGQNDQSRLKGMLNTAIMFAVGVGTITAIIMILLAPYIAESIFHKSELIIVLRLFALCIPFYVFAIITASTARAMRRINYYAAIQYLLQPIIFISCIAIFFLVTMLTVDKVVGSFIFAWMLVSMYSIFVLYKISPVLRFEIKPIYEPKKLFRFSIPIYLAAFSSLIISHFDKLILGNMVPVGEVGIYNAGVRIAAQTVLIMQAFNMITAPTIADLYHNNKIKELNSIFKTVTHWTVSLTLPVILWLVIFPDPIMNIFGAEFVAGKNVLILCCLAQFINVSTGPLEHILIMTGKQDLHLINNVILIFINIILNIVLVKKYGIMGAAVAFLISLVIINVARLIEVYILYRLFPYSKKFLKSIFAAIIAGSFVLMINKLSSLGELNWLIVSLMLFISYVLSIYLMGFDNEDRAILLLVKRKVGGILN